MDRKQDNTTADCAGNPASCDAAGVIHPDLLAVKDGVYNLSHFACSALQREAESADYGAYEFVLNERRIKFRVAKITPTKIGQFVTLWKRIGNGPIQPFDLSDPVDCFVVSTRHAENFGQFVFPTSVLCAHDIVSKQGEGGKRAIRVYPPWDKTVSHQAQKTQRWQLDYFLDFSPGCPIDLVRVQSLYGSRSGTLAD